jgi:hypothetical protein
MTYRAAAVIFLFSAFFIGVSAYGALNTAEIDRVSKKDVLEQQDLAVIDNFVAAGVKEMLTTKDFSTIGKLRDEIVARAHSSKASADIQYNPQFISAAARNLEKGFAEAKKIPDANLRAKVMLNLMILLDNLNSPQLAELALTMVDSEDTAARYWAVHAVANPNIVEQLNSGKASSAAAKTIIDRLAARINVETSPYILMQIAQFGATLNVPQAQELLMRIADGRLKKYQTGSVDDVSVDETILRLLADRMTGPDKAAAAWRFGQLYSYMMELYIREMNNDTAQSKELAAVLIATENRVLPKIGIPPSGIKRAIDRKDKQALLAEYKDLFGEGTTAGKLGTMFDIQYPSPDGAKRTTPLPLPEPPKIK